MQHSAMTASTYLTFQREYVIIGIMSLFEDNRYEWRETYFVYFESSHRPKLPEVRRALQSYASFFTILQSKADANGNLVEMTIASYEDHAALEVVYREGKDILEEAKHLAKTLKKDASVEERPLLQKIVQYKSRFDVHHFEQLAGTSVFNVMKLPELKFSRQSTLPVDHSDVFTKALKAEDEQFHFDPHSFAKCRSDHAGEELDITEDSVIESGGIERINPEMLVTVLEVLNTLSCGVALDPASGIVLS